MPNFSKSSPNSLKANISSIWKPKTSTSNHFWKSCFENVYLGENVINLLEQKVAIYLGYFVFSKNHNEPPKVAQLAKNCPILSPTVEKALIKILTWKDIIKVWMRMFHSLNNLVFFTKSAENLLSKIWLN